MVSRRAAGTGLMAGGVALLVLSLVVSAALAPTIGVTNGGDDGDDGPPRTLVGSQGGGAGLHEDGSVYLLTGDNETWRSDSADSYFDVTMLDNGSVVAGFMHDGYEECGSYSSPCVHTGFRVIEPEPEPRVVYEWSFPVRTRKNSEVHDAELLPSGEFLVTDMEYERIMTVRDGEITWQWNASERYDPPPDPTRTDWLHINDVDHVGEDRYLVSVRNANELVIVERGEGVVEVINDGGDPGVMKRQHNPQWLGEGAVLVADSENNRIIELHRTDDGDWEVVWELTSAEGVDLSWPRDADRLPNGNTLVTDSANQRIFEVNRTGRVVWSYKTPLIPYEAERLPHGETVGGPRYGPDGDDGGDGSTGGSGDGVGDGSSGGSNDGEVPVLSLLLQAIRTSFPLPFWLSEVHVGIALLSVGMVVAGGWLRFRG